MQMAERLLPSQHIAGGKNLLVANAAEWPIAPKAQNTAELHENGIGVTGIQRT